MATQTITITKQAMPQTITNPLQAVATTPTSEIWHQTTTFECVCPARDIPVCPHHQHITTGDDGETDKTGFYLRRKGQPQRHIDWETVMEENTWTRCAEQATSSFYPPEKQQNTIHTITGLCDFCLMGHRGVYSSDISRVEDQLADGDLHSRASPRARPNTDSWSEDDEVFEMIDYDMEDSMLRLKATSQTPSSPSFTLGLGAKSLPSIPSIKALKATATTSFTNTLYGFVRGISCPNNNNSYRRPSSSYTSSSSNMDVEGEPDIIQTFEEEIGLLELDDMTEKNPCPLDLEPEVWINHP